jgi:hypothetical protein
LIYSDWVKRKQAEVLSWQINKPGDNDDGGFPAEKPNDQGGVWTTSETLYTLLKYQILPPTDKRVQKTKQWLLRHRNLGGDYGDGWPLINKGNSFVDTTAMAILALSFFLEEPETSEAVKKAKDWLLENQNDDYGWGIWKYEDSLVSATAFTLLALKQVNTVFHEEKIEAALESGIAWLKLAQDKNTGRWGFSGNMQEINNASTCQAVTVLFQLGEKPKNYKKALDSFLSEFKENGTWRTVNENYTLKYFGEGLDQRLSWFNAPHVVSALVSFARSMPREVEIKQVIEAVESLKRFDAVYQSKEVTDIAVGHLDVRPWASVQYLRGLLDAQAYMQEHLDEYVSVMSSKLAIIEKAGLLRSLPIVSPFRKETSVYVSGTFLVVLFPLLGSSLIGMSYLTEAVSFEVAVMVTLFGMYLLTFGALFTGFKQKVISRSRFCYMYFPIWALIVLATGLLYIGETTEGLIVCLLIGFPEILSHVMNKTKHD